MKWVVFRGLEGDADSKEVVAYLKKKRIRYKTFKFDGKHLSEPNDVRMTETLIKLSEILTDATHVVLVNIGQIPIEGAFFYTLGLISTKSVFVVGERLGLPECLTSGFFPPCVDMEELYDRLNKYFPIFLEEEKKETARHQLFSLNIPLNPDTFAHYISADNEEVCELFFAGGMDVNAVDAAGTPMICHAARSGKINMLKWLLDKNANIDSVSSDRGYTAVMDAIWKNKFALVEFLVKKGASLDTVSKDGQPVAVLAAGVGNADICKIITKHGADVHKKDHMGMSALEYATLFNNKALIKAFSSVKK